MKRANTLAAVLFLIVLFAMALHTALNSETMLKSLRTQWAGREDQSQSAVWDKAAFVTDVGESTLNDVLDPHRFFVELYGGVQRLTGQRLVEDPAGNPVIKLDDGGLIFGEIGNPYLDTTPNAEATAAFAEELDLPFLVTIAPGKIPPGTVPLPEVLREYSNEMADNYLKVLGEKGVDTLDLREAFFALDDWGSYFFKTDHHWKPEGALYAAGVLAEELHGRYGFPVDAAALDEDNYEKTTYEHYFLGSQGKRVGAAYAGTDDFTVFTPKWETAFRYLIPERDAERVGPFEESLCFPERVETMDWYANNPYSYYAGGDWARATMINEQNPDGPKIVMIRDSFACALSPFLATQCGELTTFDLRYYQGDLAEEIRSMEPDLVMVFYTASTTRLEHMFAFDHPGMIAE